MTDTNSDLSGRNQKSSIFKICRMNTSYVILSLRYNYTETEVEQDCQSFIINRKLLKFSSFCEPIMDYVNQPIKLMYLLTCV